MIAPGYYADMVVLPEDILTVPEKRIEQMRVLMTMVGGKPVHRDADFREDRLGTAQGCSALHEERIAEFVRSVSVHVRLSNHSAKHRVVLKRAEELVVARVRLVWPGGQCVDDP